MRLSESQLRKIVKEELKKTLVEMSPMYIGSGEGGWEDEPDAPVPNPKRVPNEQAENEAYKKSKKLVDDYIEQLKQQGIYNTYMRKIVWNTTIEHFDTFVNKHPEIPYEQVPEKFIEYYKNYVQG